MGTHVLSVLQQTLPTLKMKISRVATLALAFGLLDMVNCTVVLATTTVTLASVANAVIAAKAVALGALLIASKLNRRKRQAAECLPINDPDMLFSLAVSADPFGCSQRFVCEISARDLPTLSENEAIIRSVFSSGSATAEEGSGKALLIKAATRGLNKDIALCATTYDKCPYDSKTLLKEFKKATQ